MKHNLQIYRDEKTRIAYHVPWNKPGWICEGPVTVQVHRDTVTYTCQDCGLHIIPGVHYLRRDLPDHRTDLLQLLAQKYLDETEDIYPIAP